MTQRSPLTDRQLKTLLANLNPERVSKRDQGKQSLSYLEAWDVKAALIRVFGFAGFSADLTESSILDIREVKQSRGNGMNQKVTAKATVRLTIHQTGATYTETAIAGSSQPDITEAMDMAIKSAESDALKRSAIYLGTQFGLSLYNAGSTKDVIKVVLAPDQEWPKPEQGQAEVKQMEAIIHGETPATQSMGIEGSFVEGVTPEQRAKNEALFNRAVTMKASRDADAEARQDADEAVASESSQ